MTKPQKIKIAKKLEDFQKVVESDNKEGLDLENNKNLNKQFTDIKTKFRRLK